MADCVNIELIVFLCPFETNALTHVSSTRYAATNIRLAMVSAFIHREEDRGLGKVVPISIRNADY